jgi:polyisoprenoid-binding protein YceI
MPVKRLCTLALAIVNCCATELAQARSFWTVDPAHTRITFIADAVGWPQTQGRFTNFQGKIAIRKTCTTPIAFVLFRAK